MVHRLDKPRQGATRIRRVPIEALREPIWEIQPFESAKSFEGFCFYRDLPPSQRSVPNTYKALCDAAGRPVRNSTSWVGHWSAAYKWVHRAAAYDNYKDRLRRQQLEEFRARAIDELTTKIPDIMSRALTLALDENTKDLSPQVSLIRDLLTRAGLDAPKKVEVSGPEGGPIEQRAVVTGIASAQEAREVAQILRSHGALDSLLGEDDAEDG